MVKGTKEKVDAGHVKLEISCFDGLLIPHRITALEVFRQAKKYKPPKGDIVIASYPKSGTTWMQYIVWELVHNQGPEMRDQPQVHEMWSNISRQLECHGVDAVNQTPAPRIIKTHNPVTHLTISGECKYIYVYRNPWDACISMWNNCVEAPQIFGFKDGTVSDMIDCFLDGYVPWDDYFTHVSSWLSLNKCASARNGVTKGYLTEGFTLDNESGEGRAGIKKSNILVVDYEGLKCDLRGWILKIADFLSDQHEGVKTTALHRLDDIVERTSFRNMKKLKFIVPDDTSAPEIDSPSSLAMTLKDTQHSEKVSGVFKHLKAAGFDRFHEQDFFKHGLVNYGFNYFNPIQKMRMFQKIDPVKRTHLQYTDCYFYDIHKEC